MTRTYDPRFEVVHTGPHAFHARFVAGNGETVFVSESYRRRSTAHDAVLVLCEAFDHAYRTGRGAFQVREVDERVGIVKADAR